MTEDQLIVASGFSKSKASEYLYILSETFRLYDINTPIRQTAFLAQIGHESGGGKYVKELWGPTRAQVGYEGRKDLGNTKKGDGKRYMGRGLIQITGRYNYQKTRDGMRETITEIPDFEVFPEELEKPVYAAFSAGWWWREHRLNELADKGDFKAITKKVNGGLNGWDERIKLYEAGKAAFNV